MGLFGSNSAGLPKIVVFIAFQPLEKDGRLTSVPPAGEHQPQAMSEKAVPDKPCGLKF